MIKEPKKYCMASLFSAVGCGTHIYWCSSLFSHHLAARKFKVYCHRI